MEPSQSNTRFILSCVAVLCASYIIGLGINGIRAKSAETNEPVVSAKTPAAPAAVNPAEQQNPATGVRPAGGRTRGNIAQEPVNVDQVGNFNGGVENRGGFVDNSGGNFNAGVDNSGSGNVVAADGGGRGGRGGGVGGRGGVTSIGAAAVDNSGGGALMQTVDASGRASRFGLQTGDVVLSINGETVNGADSFTELMGSIAQGSAVSIIVLRDGTQTTVGREATSVGGGRGGRGG
jgi:hypothetical protein